MNLDHDFFQVSKLSEDRKKKVFAKHGTLFSSNLGEDQKKNKQVFAKNGTFFFPNSGEDQKKNPSPKFSPNSSGGLRSHAHKSQIIGGDAVEDYYQVIERDTVKLMGGIYPPHRRSQDF